jgi:peptidoglycan/LPS O-acetylase OafA/YrhL
VTAVTAEPRTFPGLNAVRAVGALGVVATHTGFDTGEILRGSHGAFLSRLDFGVALFFVLSGFLLSRPYFLAHQEGRPPVPYRQYLWRRALRVLPLYWATTVLALLLVGANHDASWGEWLRDLTLTQIYAHGLLSYALTQMWSLCTEVLFYVLLPGVCAVLLLRPPGGARHRDTDARVLSGLAALVVTGVVWQTVVAPRSDPTHQHLHQWLPGFLPWFATGMLLAYASARQATAPAGSRWHLLERWGQDLVGCWVVGAAAFALACTPAAGPRVLVPPVAWEAFLKVALYTVAAGFLVLPLVFGPERAGLARQVMASRVAWWLGEVSYGIFCLHLLVLRTVMHVLHVREFSGSFLVVFLLTVLGTVALAALSRYVLERPALRLRTRGPFAAATARRSPASAST